VIKNLQSADAVKLYLTEAIATGDKEAIAKAVATVARGVDVLLAICLDSARVIEAMAALQRADAEGLKVKETDAFI
jgi:hypothetical protein